MYVNIKADIKDAMKSKDIERRDCLKMVIDKAKAIQKERSPTNMPDIISDDIMIQAIQKEIKQLAQTLDSVRGKNEDKYVQIAQATTRKISLLNAYLPAQMTREEVERTVFNILTGGNYPDFGSKMKAVMSELKGKVDNKIIKEVVETYK